VTFTWQELIDRSRTYVDDDHNDTEGWIAAERWLTIANVEYAQLYRRWVRMGLIAPAWVDREFTGPTLTFPALELSDDEEPVLELDGEEVLAIIGVAESLGSDRYRPLSAPQSAVGRSPWWTTSSASPAHSWQATGSADKVTITIEPPDTATYVVRYIPTVQYATDPTEDIELPYGCDERLVLGMARRAKLKDASASALLERLIMEADAEANFLAFGRNNNDSPRVRRGERGSSTPFPRHPSLYRYM
jgi:hypothetical protein